MSLVPLLRDGQLVHVDFNHGPGHFRPIVGRINGVTLVAALCQGLAHVEHLGVGHQSARAVLVTLLPDVGVLGSLTVNALTISVVHTDNIKSKIFAGIVRIELAVVEDSSGDITSNSVWISTCSFISSTVIGTTPVAVKITEPIITILGVSISIVLLGLVGKVVTVSVLDVCGRQHSPIFIELSIMTLARSIITRKSEEIELEGVGERVTASNGQEIVSAPSEGAPSIKLAFLGPVGVVQATVVTKASPGNGLPSTGVHLAGLDLVHIVELANLVTRVIVKQ